MEGNEFPDSSSQSSTASYSFDEGLPDIESQVDAELPSQVPHPLPEDGVYEEQDYNRYRHVTWEALSSYWSSLSLDEKREFLKVHLSDLENFCTTKTLKSVLELIIPFVTEHKKWTRWECCYKEFLTSEPFLDHVIEHHIVPPQLHEFLLPVDIRYDRILTFLDDDWTPLSLNDLVSESDDDERSAILASITSGLRELLESGLLFGVHMNYLRNRTRDFVESKLGEGFLNDDFDLNKWIRLLTTSHLDLISSFIYLSNLEGENCKRMEEIHYKNQILVLEQNWIYLLIPEHSFCDDSADPQIDFPSWIFEEDDDLDLMSWVMKPLDSDYSTQILRKFEADMQKIIDARDECEELFVIEFVKLVYQLELQVVGIGMVDFHRPMLIIVKNFFKKKLEDLFKGRDATTDPIFCKESSTNKKRKADCHASTSGQRLKTEKDVEDGRQEAFSSAQEEDTM